MEAEYPIGDGVAEDLDLAQFDQEFAEAEIEDFESVPDGKYHVKVEKVEFARAKSTGNPLLKWHLRIIGPEYANRLIWRNSMLLSAENIKWLKTDLHRCGVESTKLSDLPANLNRLRGITLEVTKRTKGENENVYINQRIELGDVDGGYEAAAAAARDQF